MDSEQPLAQPARVVVTDFDVSFGNLVGLILKLTFAAVPAALMLAAIGAAIAILFSACIRGLSSF